MATKNFGGFCVSSPFGSFKNDPIKDLASNTIRDFFGPTCQTVSDCILTRGPSTLAQLISQIRQHCKRDINSERIRLADGLEPLYEGRSRVKLNLARGSEEKGFVVSASAIRAALIVLQQHSVVKATVLQRSHLDGLSEDNDIKNVKFRYSIDHERAIFILRFPRYVEYSRKLFGDEGACIVEELCTNGRMLASELIKASSDIILRNLPVDDNVKRIDDEVISTRKNIISTLKKMVEDGFIESVPPLKKDKQSQQEEMQIDTIEDDDIEQLLHSSNCNDLFPSGSVWRVHIQMFHAHLQSFYLGRLVAERYGHIQFAGAIVSSALKFISHNECTFSKRHVSQNEEAHYYGDSTIFSPSDIIPFLPSPVLTALGNLPGGVKTNLSASLVQISRLTNPTAVVEIEEARGHADGGKFEVSVKYLLAYLRGRLVHQSIRDHHGDVPARICSILESKGHLEGESIAECAMVPAKDAREMLHRLYKTNYISLLYLQNAKQHNPANAIYLWYVDNKRIQRTVLLNMCKALCNLRQRRQHEVQIGKDWIERAKLADGDENDVEMDKVNYKKFCQGLERIDNACIQLDETIMVMKDF